MGQFSWFTQDTKVPIFNDWDEKGDKQTIHMVDPRDGTDYKEEGYEGYGVFGGRDFYELLVDINKDLILLIDASGGIKRNQNNQLVELLNKNWKDLTEDEVDKKRLYGIDFWFAYIEHDFSTKPPELPADSEWFSPILVEVYSNWIRYRGSFNFPDSDPNQGWHQEEEEDDDESL